MTTTSTQTEAEVLYIYNLLQLVFVSEVCDFNLDKTLPMV